MDHKSTIKRIADLILAELEFFTDNLRIQVSSDADVLAYPEDGFNEATSGLRGVRKAVTAVTQSIIQLQKEPFIAYVGIEVGGQTQVIYICRGYIPDFSPKDGIAAYVNYKAPLGRVAEKDVDSTFDIDINDRTKPVRRTIRVLEKDLFKPVREAQQWDGKNNQFMLSSGVFSIPSLRDYLQEYLRIESREKGQAVEIAQLEANLRQALERELAVKEGLSKEIRSKMSLRDQPTLDEAQGDIFRLPLSMQLIITGAPGTGKTTTLIKRISQKSDPNLLEPVEKKGLTDSQLPDYFGEEKWLMFTPTELLKIYLKEAFALEGIPASDRRIKTWDEERIRISRDILDFSKVGARGIFSTSSNQILQVFSNSDLIGVSKSFDAFVSNQVIERFNDALEVLKSSSSSPQLAFGFEKAHQDFVESNSADLYSRIIRLLERLFELRNIFIQLDSDVTAETDDHITRLSGAKESLLSEVFDTIQQYEKEKTGTAIDQEDEDTGEESPVEEPKTTDLRLVAQRQLRKTLLWYSQRVAKGQSVPKESLHARLLALLAEHLPSSETIMLLGKKAIERKATDMLTRGYTTILNRIPVFYQTFRRTMLKQEQYFVKATENAILDRKLDNNEYDLIIATILRNAQTVLARHRRWLSDNSEIPLLEKVKAQYFTQVSVDEATDFSSLQLASMFHLSHPLFKSFTLSGDLMQRLTIYGLSSWDECQFISPSFQIKSVSTVYRQSPKLLRIASKLYEHFIGSQAPFKSAFEESEADPEPLRFKSNDNGRLASWITQRVVEIYAINRSLPSIAFFVPEESHISVVHKDLSPLLKENSIELEPCYGGKILSTEGKVRIFSVEHIKGLEFEGVFFLNLDHLPPQLTELVDKYLYVGLTRAASFLAVTYAQEFPEKIRLVEGDFFEGDWSRLTM